jgi:hypothetical protein
MAERKEARKRAPRASGGSGSRSGSRDTGSDNSEPGSPTRSRSTPAKPQKATELAVQGARQLVDLTGKEFEGIAGFTRSDDGWKVQVEVLELRRVPTTTDVLAVYEVELDADGDLVGYSRKERYVRGSAGEERR